MDYCSEFDDVGMRKGGSWSNIRETVHQIVMNTTSSSFCHAPPPWRLHYTLFSAGKMPCLLQEAHFQGTQNWHVF